MSKWIQKSVVTTSAAGANATIAFTASAVSSVLVAVVASNTVLSTPTGWTLERAAVDSQALYVWTKTASAGENQLVTTRGVAGIAITAIIYELPATSTVIASTAQTGFNLSGVAVTGLSGMTSDPKLLMHYASYAPSNSSVVADIAFDDATIVDVNSKAFSSSSEVILQLSGYLEDSTFTAWAPRVLVGDVTGGNLGGSSERITIAFNLPTQLPTPVVTISSQQNPTSIGGTDGSITATWPAVAGATTYTAGIANGPDQISGFVVVSTSATSPYVFTGLAAGQYTVAVQAVP